MKVICSGCRQQNTQFVCISSDENTCFFFSLTEEVQRVKECTWSKELPIFGTHFCRLLRLMFWRWKRMRSQCDDRMFENCKHWNGYRPHSMFLNCITKNRREKKVVRHEEENSYTSFNSVEYEKCIFLFHLSR